MVVRNDEDPRGLLVTEAYTCPPAVALLFVRRFLCPKRQ